jgi:DNA-binding NtrC family response regulator
MVVASPLVVLASSSPSLAELVPALERAAAAEAPILVMGEPGTGRTTLARALHAASPRRLGPLVEVDAAAIPTTLFESELFGYRAGAFTGAHAGLPGRVARAEGGSLLLDPIEELPLDVQPKLLRLVAERRYAPLGGSEAGADVRFLAVAAPDLERRVAAGGFRDDLYFRLDVLSFRLRPLRERPEDVEALVGFFLGDLAARLGRPPVRIAARSLEWMRAYPWPGNLRELRNRLERALVLDPGAVEVALEPPATAGAQPVPLMEVERRHILAALAFTRGHQGRAARLLGISRKNLWEKRRRYGIP